MNPLLEQIKQQARDSWSGEEGERRATRVESFIVQMIESYSRVLRIPAADILTAIEQARDYSVVNYYQESNWPDSSEFQVFDTMDDLRNTISRNEFRCPRCHGVSSDPYTCNSGIEIQKGAVCDWKAYGLFGTMGQGLRFTVREAFLDKPVIDNIFMPLEMEGVSSQGETSKA